MCATRMWNTLGKKGKTKGRGVLYNVENDKNIKEEVEN